MVYRNKRTGAEIDVPCAVSGGEWEQVKETKPRKKKGEDAGADAPQEDGKKP